jgi:hypothetical protein
MYAFFGHSSRSDGQKVDLSRRHGANLDEKYITQLPCIKTSCGPVGYRDIAAIPAADY